MKPWKQFAEENSILLQKTLEELAQIPAPSRAEEKRRNYIEQWLAKQGISASVDETGNIIIPYHIRSDKKNLAAAAHMDVVFDESVPLTLIKNGSIWNCPGIGDNTINVVLLLLCAKYFREEQPETEKGIWFCVDICEEGLGNLEGCRGLMKGLGGNIDSMLAFDLYRDKIYAGCIGSVRYRITAKTPGGHSFGDFGRPNAIEILARLIEKLYQYQTVGNTTYNVGLIEGGTSVNTIAQEAAMYFEYRSDDEKAIDECKNYFQTCLQEIRQIDQVKVEVEVAGERPCAKKESEERKKQSDSMHVRNRAMAELCCEEIILATGIRPEIAFASTDCNIPLSMGIPAICAGFVRGQGAHTREEWIDMETTQSALEAAIGCLMRLTGKN